MIKKQEEIRLKGKFDHEVIKFKKEKLKEDEYILKRELALKVKEEKLKIIERRKSNEKLFIE